MRCSNMSETQIIYIKEPYFAVAARDMADFVPLPDRQERWDFTNKNINNIFVYVGCLEEITERILGAFDVHTAPKGFQEVTNSGT